jgi:hypothetical protein
MKKGIRPLFKWFGSKWQAAPKYPAPKFDRIVEPFAGGAGYSLRYPDKQVTICETNPNLQILWPWLIHEATEALVREIPIDIPVGTDIRMLGLSTGQSYLLKTWQRTNTTGGCWTISPWGNKPGQWTANTRARVAEEVYAIKHWKFEPDGLRVFRAAKELDLSSSTWFVDPMYMFNYQYNASIGHDYEELGRLVRALSGQTIVCEGAEPRTGKLPTWLPFRHFAIRPTSRKKQENHHHCKELIWTNDG